jgi:hypothetical protein
MITDNGDGTLNVNHTLPDKPTFVCIDNDGNMTEINTYDYDKCRGVMMTNGKGSGRREENRKKVEDNWPFPSIETCKKPEEKDDTQTTQESSSPVESEE